MLEVLSQIGRQKERRKSVQIYEIQLLFWVIQVPGGVWVCEHSFKPAYDVTFCAQARLELMCLADRLAWLLFWLVCVVWENWIRIRWNKNKLDMRGTASLMRTGWLSVMTVINSRERVARKPGKLAQGSDSFMKRKNKMSHLLPHNWGQRNVLFYSTYPTLMPIYMHFHKRQQLETVGTFSCLIFTKL